MKGLMLYGEKLKVLIGLLALQIIFGCASSRTTQFKSNTKSYQVGVRHKVANSDAGYFAGSSLALEKAAPMASQLELDGGVEMIPAPQRMVNYEGQMELRDVEPQQVILNAEKYVKAIGGYAENMTTNKGVFRIPSKKFEETFDSLQTFATLLSKRISAEDITDQFQDTEARIAMLKETLQRYKVLLSQAKDDKERLQLLKRIKALSLKLETLIALKTRLKHDEAYSKITMNVRKYTPGYQGIDGFNVGAFQWIDALNIDPDMESLALGTFTIDVPKGMVDLKLSTFPWLWSGEWRCASSKGSRLWTRHITTDLKGSAQFWIDAIKYKFKGTYAKMENFEAGNFKGVILTSHGVQPYKHYIAIQSMEKNVKIVEAYFPGSDEEKLYADLVKKSIEKEGKS